MTSFHYWIIVAHLKHLKTTPYRAISHKSLKLNARHESVRDWQKEHKIPLSFEREMVIQTSYYVYKMLNMIKDDFIFLLGWDVK